MCDETNEHKIRNQITKTWTKPKSQTMKMLSLLPRLLIVFIAALVGVSIGKVAAFDLVYSAISGGLIAATAVGIAALFSANTEELERTTPPRKLLGMRIGVVGFSLAIGGWLITVFVSPAIGFIIGATGIGIGFVGMAIHFVNMFRK